MNILFIHAWNRVETSYRGRFSTLLSYPSLTLPTLVSLVPEELCASVDVCDEIVQKVQYDRKQYDVVAITFDTSSSSQAYLHSREFRKRGSYVVMGGYHATAVPQEVLEHADTVIVGAGEVSLPQFLREFREGTAKRLYDNQEYDVCGMKWPARQLQNQRKSLKIPTIVADRGCDNRCKFCAISHMWRSRPRPVGDVVAEIKSLHTNKLIFFDPNFFKPREYALELMSELERLKIFWACNSTADTAFDDQLLAAAERSRCTGVLIGFESLSEESLLDVRKRYSRTDTYREVVSRMHHYHLAVNGCFVLGFDHDTEEQLLQMPERVSELGLDMIRFAILTPLPGSALFRQLEQEGRILTRDWSKYNQHYAVYQPSHMSPQRLEEIHRWVWKETYRFSRVFARLRNSPNKTLREKAVLLGANIGFKYLEL